MPPAADDLERRRIAWSILSDCYLDTEFSPDLLEGAARRVLATGYTLDELDQIIFFELHPLLYQNLLSVAGEWAGFDEDALEKDILRKGPRSRTWTYLPAKGIIWEIYFHGFRAKYLATSKQP